MAIVPQNTYSGRVATGDPGYPLGKAQNVTAPNDGTGTPWEKDGLNDIFGFQQEMLDKGGVTPTGVPEKVGASDYLTALGRIFGLSHTATMFEKAGPTFIAYRGASHSAPENTIPAVQDAAKQGFDAVNCNVQLTSDNVWILMNDDTVDRTTDGTGDVQTFTLSMIKTLDAGSWFNSYYAGTRVPTLEEFLIACRKNRLTAVIEIRDSDGVPSTGNLQNLINLCFEYFPDGQFIISSFSPTILQTVRNLNKLVDLQYLQNSYTTGAVDTCVSVGRCSLSLETYQNDISYANDRNVLVGFESTTSADSVEAAVASGYRFIKNTGGY